MRHISYICYLDKKKKLRLLHQEKQKLKETGRVFLTLFLMHCFIFIVKQADGTG